MHYRSRCYAFSLMVGMSVQEADDYLYEMARHYHPSGPCPLCGRLHGRPPEAEKKHAYAGIDDAGDDLTEWGWMFFESKGRCVWARKLTAGEILEQGLPVGGPL